MNPTFDQFLIDYLPHGLDRADGSDYGGGPVGAPTPPNAITIQSYQGGTDYQIQEDPESPVYERAEQGTLTKVFNDLSYDDAANMILSLGRGEVLVEQDGTAWKILSSELQTKRGNKASIKIVQESLDNDLPPDEFIVHAVQLNINIIKHPRYFGALNPASDDYNNFETVGDTNVSLASVKQSIIRSIQTYQDSPFFPSADNLNGLIQNNVVGILSDSHIPVQVPNPAFDPSDAEVDPPLWDGVTDHKPDGNCRYWIVNVTATDPGILLAQAAAQEIIQKLWILEDSPYMVGHLICWKTFYPYVQRLNPGGYVENPIPGLVPGVADAVPSLPDYFYSPTDPMGAGGINDATNIFDAMAALNPQCYSSDGTLEGDTVISCLRQADDQDFERTFFSVTRSWLCAAVGVWDADINSSDARPSTPEEYATFDSPAIH